MGKGTLVEKYYLSLINKVEKGNVKSCGEGAFKIAYPFLDDVVLKHINGIEYHRAGIHDNIKKNIALRNLDISTPELKYYYFFNKRINDKNIESLYEIQERARGSVMYKYPAISYREDHIEAVTNLNKLKSKVDEQKSFFNRDIKKMQIMDNSNNMYYMLKQYAVLKKLGLFCDNNSGNMMYSFENGYMFIDLSLELLDYDLLETIKNNIESIRLKPEDLLSLMVTTLHMNRNDFVFNDKDLWEFALQGCLREKVLNTIYSNPDLQSDHLMNFLKEQFSNGWSLVGMNNREIEMLTNVLNGTASQYEEKFVYENYSLEVETIEPADKQFLIDYQAGKICSFNESYLNNKLILIDDYNM